MEERLALRKKDAFIHVDVRADLAAPTLDYLMHSFAFNLQKPPAFIH